MVHRGITIFSLFILFGVIEVQAQTWVQMISAANVLGCPLAYNPQNANTFYGSAGTNRLYISYNRGRTWSNYGNPVPGGGIIKSIAVNQDDTLKILVGVESASGSSDRIMRSIDGADTWTEVWGGTFSFYGRPVEFKPEHPDTVYTMGSDTIWRSTNFGTSWDTVRRVTNFNTWCDGEIRPDSANIMYIGDNLSGIWKTTDHGANWTKKYSTFGEIPSIAIDPFNPRVAYAGKYGGGGGIVKTTNGGETWSTLAVPSGSRDTWWVTCSREHRGHVYYGTYTGDTSAQGIFFSRDSGASWQRFKTGLSPSAVFNYGLMAVDSLSVVAVQSNGLYRLNYPTSVSVGSPNGGERFSTGSQQLISWSSAGLYYLKLELTTNNGASWNIIADSVPSSQTSYLWTVPSQFSDSCRIRISDRIYTTTADTSDSVFAISNAVLMVEAPNGGEVLTVGSHASLEWTAQNIGTISIDFTTDSGSTWDHISTVPGTASSYSWLVPNSPSGNCRIRLTDITDSAIVDSSDSLFSIQRFTTFVANISMTDNGGLIDSLEFANATNASDDIDTVYGETALGPGPGPGNYDFRWILPNASETLVDYRDTLSESNDHNTYLCAIQPGPGGYPCTLRWNPEELTNGAYLLRDTATHGGIILVDMRCDSILVVSDTTIGALEIYQCLAVNVQFPGIGDWRLVSLPMIQADRSRLRLFPYSGSGAYAYNGGYKQADSLQYGEGYWLKNEQTVLSGCPILSDSFTVGESWNIIGSLSKPVAVASITSSPGGIVTSSFFGYNGGYYIADTLYPGEGYWVKTTSAGKLALTTSPSIESDAILARPSHERFHSLTIADGRGKGQMLYFGADVEKHVGIEYDLPPLPPGKGFAASFGSRQIAEGHPQNFENQWKMPLSIQNVGENIFFSWLIENEKNFTYILLKKFGSQIAAEYQLTARGNLVVPTSDRQSFSLAVRRSNHGSADIPHEYLLGEFYPNPFNPSTRCSYTVPSDAHVRVAVFSVLGEEVSTLVNGVRAAGSYQVEWNGSRQDGTTASSGIYFVRMSAHSIGPEPGKEFSSIRRIVYIR